MGILTGIRVLELARFVAGPYTTQMMGDFGAEVIKIEEPGSGEPGRTRTPLWNGVGAEYFATNRGKKSLTLNLRTSEGREVFARLVAKSDVVVDVYRPGMLKKLGIGYEACQAINPRIVYCAMNGYGSEGAMSQQGGHDINFLSLAGAMSLLGPQQGKPVIPPFYLSSMAGAAIYAFGAIMMALYERERSGRGQYCEIGMFDSALAGMSHVYAAMAGLGRAPRRGGELLTGGYACYNVYECSDGGYISLGAVEDKFWGGFCRLIGRPEFIPLQWEPERQPELQKSIEEIFITRTRDEWVDFFSGQDVCLTPILTLDEVPDSDLAREKACFTRLASGNAEESNLYAVAPVIKMPQCPADPGYDFVPAGHDADEILAELGYSQEQITAFHNDEIV